MWEAKDPASIGLAFEKGWYFFLTGNYEKAINNFEQVVSNLDGYYEDQLKYAAFRNLAGSYESIGNKEKADEWFKKGEKYANQNNVSEKVRNAGYQEFPAIKERNKKSSK